MNNQVTDYLKEIGRRGGEKTKQTRDPDYYKKIGAKGLKKRWKEKTR